MYYTCDILGLEGLEIKDVGLEDIDSLNKLCVPPEKRNDELFIEGMKVKERWARKVMEVYGSIAKIAYLNSEPIGLIQYEPKVEEKIVEISCIFVPHEEYQRRGVGRALLQALMEDVGKPLKIFNYEPPLALVTWAFDVPGFYPQSEFYLKMGFRRVEGGDPNLLYYPLREGYVYRPLRGEFTPLKEDLGKALIFYSPSCPFCMYFSEYIKRYIREVVPEMPIRTINMFEEAEEVRKRGRVPPLCS